MLQALTLMTVHDSNPRVATAASWALAAACHVQRQNKATTAVAANTAVGAQLQALAGLPEDGAMRALAQAVLTGCCTASSYGYWHCLQCLLLHDRQMFSTASNISSR